MKDYTSPSQTSPNDHVIKLQETLKRERGALIHYIYELGGSQREIARRINLSNSRIQQLFPMPKEKK